jgi:hypothetical protein
MSERARRGKLGGSGGNANKFYFKKVRHVMKTSKKLLSMILILTMAVTLFAGLGVSATAVADDVTASVSIVIEGVTVDEADFALEDGSTVYDLVAQELWYYDPVWLTVPDFQYTGVTYEALDSFAGYGTEFIDYYYDYDAGYYVFVYNAWVYTVNGVRLSEIRPGVDFPVELYMEQYVIEDGDVIVLEYNTWYEPQYV